ncbi:MAG: hypothetical protein JXA93_05045 [Anaerolineae bacterium]|nr:hypothetical protein [Anaerolineae bacterium]
MSTWVIPYVDQDLDFWQEVHARFGAWIREVYFPMPAGGFASGRSRQPEQHLEIFVRDAPLPKALVINPIVLSRPVEEVAPPLLDVLRRMRDDLGIDRVTIANLSLARIIKEALPTHYVTASVLLGIATPAQALIAANWVDAISPDTRLVRDLAGLRQLRASFAGELRLLVNEACIPGCPFRTQHFYEMAYSDRFPQSLCAPMLAAMPWLRLTGAWVLPRHLHYYDGLYDTLKLAGRVTLRDPQRYLSVLDAYVHRREILPRDIGGGPASPLNGLEVDDAWFEFVIHCDKRCDRCGVCREYYDSYCHEGEKAQ